MKEFIEKLIGRLEEYIETAKAEGDFTYIKPFEMAKNAVNQLAEEYKSRRMINGQYCWQTCGSTEHCKECNRLGNGSIDYFENYDFMAEGNADFCEWNYSCLDEDLIRPFHHKGAVGMYKECLKNNPFCSCCGKKIKAVEPKGE